MAVSLRGRNTELQVSRKWKERDNTSPERTKIWTEPNRPRNVTDRKVPVVYYLCRNGQLEHPHFMEVPLSSNDGLYLRDVINRLNQLRGKGMASLYSWSSKRNYKNGFVWHDLAENDFIYPAQGLEYVLKGSELLAPSPSENKPLWEMTQSSRSLRPPLETQKSSSSYEESDFPVISRRRNQSWSSTDFNEYKVYKAESFSESTEKLAADASTQTDDKRRRRRQVKQEEEIQELPEEKSQEREVNREEIEISPPPSDSSPETLESLMKADGRLVLSTGSSSNEESLHRTVENCGKIKASNVLMQLISCGSISFRDCGATAVKEQGLSLLGQYRARLPRGAGNGIETSKEISSFAGIKLEDKEYFSGSLIETKKEEVPALKRSNSYNADRSSQLQLAEKEIEGVRTKCIPRKSKATQTNKSNISVYCETVNNNQTGTKKLEPQQLGNEAK